MGMVRMFHMSCDGPDCLEGIDHDDYYATTARDSARAEGWHVSANYAICAECWAAGVRFKDVR
jgi:hypothetical protein